MLGFHNREETTVNAAPDADRGLPAADAGVVDVDAIGATEAEADPVVVQADTGRWRDATIAVFGGAVPSWDEVGS
jgi:hypothetical protein